MYLSREMMADGILTKTVASNDWMTVALLSKSNSICHHAV